jgi:hypothetical protein
MRKEITIVALAFGAAAGAQAQGQGHESGGPTVSVGLRGWQTEWDTFSYHVDTGNGNSVVVQAPAEDKFVLLPVLSVRWRDFTGSLSLYPSTDHDFVNGGRGTRKEFDLNLGYFVTPGVALTLGYKKIEQADGPNVYALSGPVAGVSGTAPLGRDFALYGSFGMGWMKSTGSSTVKFDADYRLSELGIAYTVPTGGFVRAVTLTAGYRTQVLTSKEALGNQDGRDLTQGFTLGAIATF